MKKFKTIKSIINKNKQIGIDGVFCKLAHNTLYCCGMHERHFELCYEEKVTKYIRENYSYLCERYREQGTGNREQQRQTSNENGTIFSFWNSNNLPPLIESCFESQRKNAGKHEHIVLTNKTIPNYCNIPGYIWDKYFSRKIPVQTFSDILRMSLLFEHGGLWLDSTIFVAKPIPDLIFSCDYWQHKFSQTMSPFLGKYGYGGMSAFASHAKNIVPEFCRECFYTYWDKEEILIEYFFIAVFLLMGIDYIKEIKELYLAIPENNANILELKKKQDQPYNSTLWNKLVNDERDIGFFKMNWRNPPKNQPGSFWNEINRK
jgi:hypothetical protein